MWLKFIDVDESFPYHVFKKGYRDRYLDNKQSFVKLSSRGSSSERNE